MSAHGTERIVDRYAVKMYREGADTLVAACDPELLGRTFRDEENGTHISVSEDFYHGVLVERDALKEMMRMATILNLVGERTIRTAKEIGLVDGTGVMLIGGVPHAQVIHII